MRERLTDGLAFSPDERFAVAVGGPEDKWWWTERDEADWDGESEPPSSGSVYDLGAVYVHDLAGGAVTRHRLVTELPAGWQPRARTDDWYGWGWQGLWGPEFRGDRAFGYGSPTGAPSTWSCRWWRRRRWDPFRPCGRAVAVRHDCRHPEGCDPSHCDYPPVLV